MGFRINTNVAALSAHANASMNNRAIDNSLNKLNSGFRINSAADDASGMAIADSLRSQASSLGQAIMNANDAIGIVQTADKAMDEQIKILDTIKNKAIQSAQDGQTTETRRSLQADISRLMEELDNIGNTTSFNGQKLLSGTFSNKEFQIGAYSNETVKASIGATTSDKIGLTRFETGHNVRASDLTSTANFTFKNVDGINDVTFEPVELVDKGGNIKAGMGLGALAEAINKATDKTGVKASVTVETVFEQPIKAGSTTAGFSINGVMIGVIDVKEKDGNGALRAAINSVKDQTGVEASVDSRGRLVLNNRDGRGIKVEDNISMAKPETDLHSLVADGMKKDVDLNLKDTWTVGAEGSILNSKNTFADVRTAHGTQDAVIFGSAKKAAAEAKQPGGKVDLTSLQLDPTIGAFSFGAVDIALGGIKGSMEKALETLKSDLQDTIKTNILDVPAKADSGNTTNADGKKVLDAAATTFLEALETAKGLSDISKAITDLNTAYGTGQGFLNGAKTEDEFKKALVTDISTFTNSIKTSVDSAVALTEGSEETRAKALNEAATAFATAIEAATTAFGTLTNTAEITAAVTAIGTLGGAIETYETAAKDVGEPSETMKQLGKAFADLKAQTTVDGANAAIEDLNKALDKVINAAAGKTMNTKEAQDGMYAHGMKEFMKGLQAGLNENDKAGMAGIVGLNVENSTNFGRLSLASTNGRDIQVNVTDANGYTTNSAVGYDKNVAEKTVSLRETNGTIDRETADAMGFNSNDWQATDRGDNENGYPAGVMTLKGAQAMMNIAEAAQKALEAIRSDLGSVQNQLVVTVNNISVTQVNVKAAESNIRDVDFAQESATFSKHQILAQSGVYAMSQANAVQQNVMRLLQ